VKQGSTKEKERGVNKQIKERKRKEGRSKKEGKE
jgi:hypothetical protein